ncbi:iron ABC transporter permease [Escherichia coli]|uniref:Iron ABC transporter permease n=1 Tax=Escherichia coli TaxID=562 RepID=A0A376VM05_ECOLX|nr:iron ABC transporter permease [Escherichia coli]
MVTPGATAWLLTDRFPRLLIIAVTIGSVTSFLGAWVSYFSGRRDRWNHRGGADLLFLLAFVFAPTMGFWQIVGVRIKRWRIAS